MEIITMESSAYKKLLDKIDALTKILIKKDAEYMSQDICLDDDDMKRLLGVSHRTLQRMRSNNTITYSKIGRKCSYELKDIKRAISDKRIFCKQRTLNDFCMEYELKRKK